MPGTSMCELRKHNRNTDFDGTAITGSIAGAIRFRNSSIRETGELPYLLAEVLTSERSACSSSGLEPDRFLSRH